MDFDKSIDAAAVHMSKGKQGDILRLPAVMILDCRTNLALQVSDLYSHARIEMHLYDWPVRKATCSWIGAFHAADAIRWNICTIFHRLFSHYY